MVSVDFFTVPTIRFQVLYVFLVLAHDRRRIIHFNVTAHSTAEWTVQQLREACPFEQIPRYLLRDRDGIFGNEFRQRVKAMGIEEVLSTPRSPWPRAYVERVIGNSPRVPGSCDRVQRSYAAPAGDVLSGVLLRISDSSVVGQRPAGNPGCAARECRQDSYHRASGRAPSQVRTSRRLNSVDAEVLP